MPTTPRSSSKSCSPGLRRALLAGACLFLSSQLAACISHTQPVELFQLTPESPRNKAMQTRFFETKDEVELLRQSVHVPPQYTGRRLRARLERSAATLEDALSFVRFRHAE